MKAVLLVAVLFAVAVAADTESLSVHRLKKAVLSTTTITDDSQCLAQRGQCVYEKTCNVHWGTVVTGLCPGITVCCVGKANPPANSHNGSPAQTGATPAKVQSGRRPTTVHLLMGLGDQFTSPGVLTQAAKIRTLGPDVTATVWTWFQWDSALADFQAKPNTKHVVIGYSNGASMVQKLADSGVALDLLISEDPTIWLPTYPLKANVKKAICFHNTNWMSSIPPVGHASLVPGAGFNPANLQTIDTQVLHTQVDTDPSIIAVVLKAVNAVVQAP